MAIKVDLNMFLELIPDELICKLSHDTVCKLGSELITSEHPNFTSQIRSAKSYVNKLNCGTYEQIAYYFYSAFKNQKENIDVPGLYEVLDKLKLSDYMKDLYCFGIYDSTAKATLTSVQRRYIVPIEGIYKEDVLENLTEFMKEYLPEEVYNLDEKGYVTFELEDGSKLKTSLLLHLSDGLLSLPPLQIKQEILNIPQLNLSNQVVCNLPTDTNDQIHTYEQLQYKIKFYERMGIKPIDVTDIVTELYDELYGFNTQGFTILNQTINKIVDRVNENGGPGKAIIFSANMKEPFKFLIAALKYLHNVPCIAEHYEDDYHRCVSALYYSEYMLAGDKINYIRNFPTYLSKIRFSGTLLFHTVTRNRNVICTAARLNDDLTLGDVETLRLDIQDMDVEFSNTTDLFDYSNVNSIHDMEELKHKDLLLRFYHKIKESENTNLDFPNPCNTAIVTIEGKRYIARVNRISNIRFEGYMAHLESKSIAPYTLVDLDQLEHWVPMREYNDYEFGLQLLKTLENVLNVNVDSPIIEAKKLSTINTVYYRYFYENSLLKQGKEIVPNAFIDACLNVSSARSTRREKLWMKLFNNSDGIINQLTSFYCTDPTKAVKIDVEESMLIDKYVKGGFYD